MRGVTTVSLTAFVFIGGFLQIVLGLDAAVAPRVVMLIVPTVVSVGLALALIPSLLRYPDDERSGLPLALALTAVAGATWILAMVAPFAGWGWGFMLAVAGGMLSCVVAGWWRAAVLVGTIGLLTLGMVLSAWALSVSPPASRATEVAGSLVIGGTLVLMTLSPLSTVWVLRVALRLDDARHTAADLAIATERLRFATDLHDIQGHHLQVIALKSELAERRLASGDTSLAAAEVSDIRSLARTALDDTRAVVNAYRTVTVAVEARNAAEVLRSAGIDCAAHIDAHALTDETGTIFAVAIREATTNILRHSAATVASFDLSRSGSGDHRLTVVNDGAVSPRAGGTGIAGLVTRASAWGGAVDTEYRDGTFTLTVTVPAADGRSSKEQR